MRILIEILEHLLNLYIKEVNPAVIDISKFAQDKNIPDKVLAADLKDEVETIRLLLQRSDFYLLKSLLRRISISDTEIELKPKIGRKTREEENDERINMIALLIAEAKKRQDNYTKDYIGIEYLADKLDIDPRTAQKKLDDLLILFEDIRQEKNRIVFSSKETYYYKSKLFHTEEKKILSTAFVSAFKDDHKDVYISNEDDKEPSIQIPTKLPSLAAGCGTTVTRCIEAIFDEPVELRRLLSNNLALEHCVKGRKIDYLEFTGGRFDPQIYGTTDSKSITSYGDYSFNTCILGVSGINKEGDFSVAFSSEVGVIKQMIKSTNDRLYIVACADKLCSQDQFKFGNVKEIKVRFKKSEEYKQVQEEEKIDNQKDLDITLITTDPEDLNDSNDQFTVRKPSQAQAVIDSLRNLGVKVIIAKKS